VVVGSYSCLTALAEDLIGQSALEWGKRHVILSIIDSQPSAIDPAFIHANETPDFAEETQKSLPRRRRHETMHNAAVAPEPS
jgi:hypothetical protein